MGPEGIAQVHVCIQDNKKNIHDETKKIKIKTNMKTVHVDNG